MERAQTHAEIASLPAQANGSASMAPPEPSLPPSGRPDSVRTITRIEAGRAPALAALRELWDQRELLYFFAWRDVKVRYKQTALGAAWAVLQPLLTMLLFTVVFGRLAKIPSDGVPYPIFAYAALLPWTFFSNAVALSAVSLVTTPDLITKVYFPRLTIPIASTLGGLLDFAVGGVGLVALGAYYGIVPGIEALAIIPLLLLALVTAMGVGLILSALNVEYRDVRYIVPFLIQLWLFATPIAYPSSLFDEPWRTLLGLNPMVGVVEGFRWALLGTSSAPGPMILASVGTALALIVGGFAYFRRVQDKFADVI
jgi:lipopolysaccharide transport system permease protein